MLFNFRSIDSLDNRVQLARVVLEEDLDQRIECRLWMNLRHWRDSARLNWVSNCGDASQ